MVDLMIELLSDGFINRLTHQLIDYCKIDDNLLIF